MHRSSFIPRIAAAALAVFAPLALAAPPERSGAPQGRTDHPRERAEWNAGLREDRAGRVASENRLKALKAACELPVDASMAPPKRGISALASFPGVAWQSLGPRPAKSDHPEFDFRFGTVSGRVTALAAHPANASFLLAGGATGGIWKSTDAGTHWRPVADGAPALAISSFAFSPSNPNVVYAATGEADSADLEFKPSNSQGTYLGAGLLRSVDGGETWTRIDVDLPANSVLSRVLVHRTNPQLVLVGLYIYQDLTGNRARAGGVFRSTDGGVHFTKVVGNVISDLVQDPNAADAVYTTYGSCSSCPDPSGVYKSTDFGATFAPSLVPGNAAATFTSPSGNIKLAAAGNPTTVYASVLAFGDAHDGIYRTTDAGATWMKRAVDVSMCPDAANDLNQCSYDHFITVRPDDVNAVFLGTVNLYKSTDGALTWTKLTNFYSSGGTVHPDQHVAIVPPQTPGTLLIGNDGGVFRTTDGGTSFQTLNDSLTLEQFNGIAFHPTNPAFFMGGTQDNGNLRFTNSFEWSDRTAGDGGFNLIDQRDPTKVLSANFQAYMNYSTDGGVTFNDATSSKLQSIEKGPTEPMSFYPPAMAAPGAPDTIFFGATRLWVNKSFGCPTHQSSLCTDWSPTSTTSIKDHNVITAMDVLGDGTGVIWIGLRCRSAEDGSFTCPTTGTGSAALSTDGGATWAERGSGLPGALVTRVRTVSADGKSAYLTAAGFSGATSQHVFRTTDAGQTWTNVSGNLPDVPVTSFAIDPGDPNDLFVGTDVGVFRSVDGGASWASFNQGMPNASVYELAFHPLTGDLIAATYGRGLFRVAAAAVAPAIGPSADFSFSPGAPSTSRPVAFADLSVGTPTSWSWDFGDGTSPSTDRNPSHTFNQSGQYKTALTVTNAAGSAYRARTVTVTDGAFGPVTVQVPVVLDVYGKANSHFTSDLVLVNRSSAASRVSMLFTTAPGQAGSGGPTVQETIAAGRELRIGDVISYLRDRGYAFPFAGGNVGTLVVTFEDVSDASQAFAGSRTSTPNPDTAKGGSFGLFFGALPTAAAPSSSAIITGLREDGSFRSNLALADVPGGSGAAQVSIQVYDGDTGAAAGAPIVYALRAGEWHQQNSPLADLHVANGWARLTRTGGGTDRFLAYGSLVDGGSVVVGTSDGSILGTDAAEGLLPVVLHYTSGPTLFTTELILTNPTSASATVTLAYTAAGGATATRTVTLGAKIQKRYPDAIAFLRDELGMPLAPGDANNIGTLLVTGALAYARTSNPALGTATGGTFGLAYPAVAAASRAKTEAWVYGLVQNGETRSNLAIADARVGNATPVTYLVDVFDAVSGSATPVYSQKVTGLSGGQFAQINAILSSAKVASGYVRVRPESGTSDFVVYGVLNDGATNTERTQDGSYVAMSGVK